MYKLEKPYENMISSFKSAKALGEPRWRIYITWSLHQNWISHIKPMNKECTLCSLLTHKDAEKKNLVSTL